MYNQDYNLYDVRTAAILTGSYVAGTVLGPNQQIHLQNQLILYVDFTIGSLTNATIKVEFSPDGTNYYQETFGSISSGTETDTLGVHVIAATGKYRIPVQIKDRYIKISVLGTGTVTNSSMAIKTVIGIA